MTTPVWMLLTFATWTTLLLVATIGVYRWSRILTRRAGIGSFRAGHVEGADWYARATRAHANCLENLPIFGAIVFALYVGNVTGSVVDALTVTVVIARILQSLIHVSFVQTNRVVAVRFTFFFVQVACFLWLIEIIFVRHMANA